MRFVLLIVLFSLARPAYAELDERIQVTIEEPVQGERYSGISNLRGWAVSPEGMGNHYLSVYIDEKFAFYMVPYGQRTDVGEAFPNYPGSDTGGFSMAFNYKDLSPGEHEIRVRAYDNANNYNDAVTTFTAERFETEFIAKDSDVDISTSQTWSIIDKQTYLVSGATLEGKQWDFLLKWDRASQSFKMEGILPFGSDTSVASSPTGEWAASSGSDGITSDDTDSSGSDADQSLKIFDRENLELLRANDTYNHDISEVADHWAEYELKLSEVAEYFDPLPIGLNLESKWFKSISIPKSTFVSSRRGNREQTFEADHLMTAGVGYGNHLLMDNGNILVFYSNWDNYDPDMGNTYAVEYENQRILDRNGSADPSEWVETYEFEIVGIASRIIGGATRSHVLRNQDGSVSILTPGVDEAYACGISDSYVFDLQERTWQELGIVIGAHSSMTFDYENDGDDDVIAMNWAGCGPQGKGTENGQPLIIRNLGKDRFDTVLLSNNFLSPGSIAAFYQDSETIGVIGGDGCSDLGPGILSPAHQFCSYILYYDANEISGEPKYAEELPVPYFDRPLWRDALASGRIASFYESSHEPQIVVADLNGDGLRDIVFLSMIWSSSDPVGVPQLLINKGGYYEDETDSRLFGWLMAGSMSHEIELLDVNGDGFKDLLLSDHGNGFDKLDKPRNNFNSRKYLDIGQNTQVLVNDGTGHFYTQIHTQLFSGCRGSDTPALGPDGRMLFMCINAPNTANPGYEAEIRTTQLTRPLSTGPFGLDPADFGVPGFNEFFYLRTYPEALRAVELGEYASGLEHYLAVGGFSNNRINARAQGAEGVGVKPALDDAPQ